MVAASPPARLQPVGEIARHQRSVHVVQRQLDPVRRARIAIEQADDVVADGLHAELVHVDAEVAIERIGQQRVDAVDDGAMFARQFLAQPRLAFVQQALEVATPAERRQRPRQRPQLAVVRVVVGEPAMPAQRRGRVGAEVVDDEVFGLVVQVVEAAAVEHVLDEPGHAHEGLPALRRGLARQAIVGVGAGGAALQDAAAAIELVECADHDLVAGERGIEAGRAVQFRLRRVLRDLAADTAFGAHLAR